MAHLYSLIVVVLLLVSQGAVAATCADVVASLTASGNNFVTTTNANGAACRAANPGSNCYGAAEFVVENQATPKAHRLKYWYRPDMGSTAVTVAYSAWSECSDCPPPGTSFTMATDNGSVGSCGVNNCKAGASGIFVSKPYTSGAAFATSYECTNGCVSKTKFDFAMKWVDGAGVEQFKQVGETMFTGGACATVNADGSTAAKPAPLDSLTNPNSAKRAECPSGQIKQMVNGVSVCAPPGSGDTTTTSKTTTSTDAAGNKTVTVATTTCTGSECTTTYVSTVTPSGGTPGAPTTTTDTKPKTTFCQDNPTLSICKTGSFSGSCSGQPACTGDAVMCAVAAATYKTNCALSPDANAESALYDQEKGKTGEQVSTLPGSKTETFGANSFAKTELLGAPQGLSDFSVQVMGSTVDIRMSSVNIWLGRLGLVLQAIAFMLAVRIVGRGY